MPALGTHRQRPADPVGGETGGASVTENAPVPVNATLATAIVSVASAKTFTV